MKLKHVLFFCFFMLIGHLDLIAQSYEQVTFTEYENKYFQVRKTKTIDSKSKKIKRIVEGTEIDTYDRFIETSFTYPFDYTTSPKDDVQIGMTNKNMVSIILTKRTEIVIYNSTTNLDDRTPISEEKTEYDLINGMYLPIKIFTTQSFTAQKEPIFLTTPDIIFDSYDANGNVLSYTLKNGLTTTFEYYGSSDSGKENLVKKQTNSLGHVTKYDYKPLVGLKKVTDPNKKVTIYEYDEFGRLKLISDATEEISPSGVEGVKEESKLKEYTYNYASNPSIFTAIGALPDLSQQVQPCSLCCNAEANAGSNSPIVNCSSGQISLNATGSSTGDGITYYWTGPNNFISTVKNPTITGDISKAGGVYSLKVTKKNATCDVSSIATTTVILDCACPFTVSTSGTTVGPLACQSTISLVSNCVGCSNGELQAGSETYVVNGKFDNTNIATKGFSSDCNTEFTSNPQLNIGSFNSFPDHTGNSGGKMLLVSNSEVYNERVWYQTVTVKPNTRYVLSAWITAAYNNNPTKVNWDIDAFIQNETVDMVSKNGGQWQQLKTIWTSGNQTSVVIALRKQNTISSNWFVIDDISMTEVPVAATFEWSGPDGFTATGKNAFVRNVGAKNGGKYLLTVVDKGCTKITEVNVSVNCQPCLDATPLTVYVNSNSPVSCGANVNLFASSNKRDVTYTWYKINSDGTDVLFPEAEKNKQNPTIIAPVINGLNRYGYMVAAYKDGCTASYTVPVEVKCIQDGDTDIAMNVIGDEGVTNVTVGQQFGICGQLINQSPTNNVGSVRASILLPECLEFTGPTWGLSTGAHEEIANSFYEDIWYNPVTREVSNLTTQARRGTDTWKYWGVSIGAGQSRYMCFGVKALKAGTIVVKGQISVVETTQAQSMRDKDSEPGNGYDNGEDDRAVLTLNTGVNSINLSTYQIRQSFNSSINDVDVTSVNSTWTATVSDPWISIDKTTGINGLSTIKVTLANNASAKTRFGTLTIDGGCGLVNIVKIKQAAKEDCPTIDLSSNNPFCNNPLQLFANLIPSTNKELITNGSFEKGNIDFSSEALHYYDPQIGGTLAYVVSANPKTENGSTGMGFINMECPGTNTSSSCNIVNRVRLLFRSECCFDRLNGARIQVSNDKNTWTTLYTFGNATGAWQDVSFSNTQKYMYVRFVASSTGYGELREIEFYNGTTKLSGLMFGSTAINGNNVLANAMDGLENNLWHGSAVGQSNFIGLELEGCTLAGIQESESTCNVVNRARLLFRSECCFDRLNGARIQVSNDKNTWTTLYTFGNATGAWQDVSFSNTQKYMYVRFVSSSTGYGELREIEFYNGTTKLSGQIFGSTAINGSNVLANAMDGLENNLWHGSAVGESNFVGLELSGCTLAGIQVNDARGSGKQMAVTASWKQKEKFWSQTILVDPNTDYKISVKAVQLGNYDNVPVQLIFDVDGVPTNVQGTISTSGCTWQKISGIWNSGEKFGPVKLTLTFVNSNFNNKIFAIDDISVKPNLQGTTSNSPVTYAWIAPTTEAQNDLIGATTANPVINIVKGKHTGIYKLTATQNECPITEVIDVDISCSSLTCPVPVISSPYAKVCINMGQKATLNAIGCPLGSTVRWSDGQTSTPQSYTNPSTGVVTTISTVLTAAIKTGTSYFAQCQTECGISNKSNDLFVHAVDVPNAPVISPSPLIEKKPGDDGTILTASGCNDGIIKWSNGTTGFQTWIPAMGYRVGDYVEVTAKCLTECSESVASNKVKIIVTCSVQNPSSAKAIEVPACGVDGGSVTLEGVCPTGTVVWYKEGDQSFEMTGNRITTSATGNVRFKARCKLSTSCVSDYFIVDVAVGSKPNKPTISSQPSVLAIGTPLVVGVNSTVVLFADNCPTGSIVNWTLTGYSTNSFTGSSITLVPTAVGSITAKATCKLGQCTSDFSDIFNINVITPPCTLSNTLTISPSGDVTSSVKNSSLSLTASGCPSGVLKWELKQPDQTALTKIAEKYMDTGTSTLSVSVNTSVTKSYVYIATCNIANCEFTKSKTVNITTPACSLSVSFAKGTEKCGETELGATSSKTNVTYQWYYRKDNTYLESLMSIASSRHFTTLDGDYKVKIIDNDNPECFTTSSWLNIVRRTSLSAIPTISSTTTAPINKGNSVVLTATGCPSGTSYVWSDNQTVASITVIPEITTAYTVKCVESNSNVSRCEGISSEPKTITVICSSSPPTLQYDSPSSKVCKDQNLTVKAIGCTGTVKWYESKNSTTVLATTATYTTNKAKIFASCTASGSTCESVKDSIITQVDFGRIDIVPNCDFTKLESLSNDEYTYSYRWLKDSNVLTGETSSTLTVQGNGTYVLEMTRLGTECKNTTSYTISSSQSKKPEVTLAKASNVCGNIDLTTTIGNTSLALSPYEIDWFRDDKPLRVDKNVTSTSSTLTATESGVYKVKVITKDGCYNEKSMSISIINNIPTPTITSSAECIVNGSGSSITLTANGCGDTNPIWTSSLSSIPNTVQTSSSITVSQGSSYTLACEKSGCIGSPIAKTISACSPQPTFCSKLIRGAAQYNETIDYFGVDGKMTALFEVACIPGKLKITRIRNNVSSVVVETKCMGYGYSGFNTGDYSKDNISTYPFDVINGDKLKIEVFPNCSTNQYNCPSNATTDWGVTLTCPLGLIQGVAID